MMKKILAGAGILAALALLALAPAARAEQMSTTTLGASIDQVNGVTYDYFTVLLAHYWPFVVGFGILVLVIGFGKRIIAHFA